MRKPIAALAATVLALTGAGVTAWTETSAGAAPTPDNPVTLWNRISQAAVSAPPPGSSALRPPAGAQVLQGIVQAAVYDAVVAIEGGGKPFLTAPHVVRPASVQAAIAAAARGVLVARVPAQEATVDGLYEQYLASLPDGPPKENGVSVGERVASEALAWRANDGFDNDVPYVQPAAGPGVFEPVAPPGQTPGKPVDIFLSGVKPLTFASYVRFRPDGPPKLTSPRYAKDFAEVQAYGRADSSVRTADQTDIARFWSEHAFNQYNRNIANIALAQGLDITESARLLALAHVTLADTVITCYSTKYHYRFWRPVTAVKRADTDGNPATVADPTWESLLVVNHPEYPSGHSCWSTALAEVLSRYFGTDKLPLTIDSTVAGLQHPVHTFARISDLPQEVYNARIYAGIHFRFSDEDGATIGRSVATYVASKYFRPEHGRR